ncbi:class I SAM-dependent methyltransferase [Reyranella massiliensis]|uniref:class I SAM-dependent methyltransferase n=1 Tax=Reyranella massiliensis TaxID=445220 RepID=UPI000304CC13|nr:class I SAM-dependent methyltransferase [Reyranella massiliensis]
MTASPWIVTWAGLLPADATVLDIAAGKGRHSRYFAARGHRVTAIDRDVSELAAADGIEVIAADLEDGSPWPLSDRRFGAVVVTNYLHRPLFPVLFEALQPGGILLYETFMVGNERFGKPSRPEFLLKDGELLDLVRGRFSVTAYEARMISEPRMAMVQRIAARKTS